MRLASTRLVDPSDWLRLRESAGTRAIGIPKSRRSLTAAIRARSRSAHHLVVLAKGQPVSSGQITQRSQVYQFLRFSCSFDSSDGISRSTPRRGAASCGAPRSMCTTSRFLRTSARRVTNACISTVATGGVYLELKPLVFACVVHFSDVTTHRIAVIASPTGAAWFGILCGIWLIVAPSCSVTARRSSRCGNTSSAESSPSS